MRNFMLYNLIIRLKYNKCRKGYIWCVGGDFIDPSKFRDSGRTAYGYALDDHKVARLKRSSSHYIWDSVESYCTECISDGKSGYFPDMYELYDLYGSVMSGDMKTDLITAGIYEECNYRGEDAYGNQPNWFCVWSRLEFGSNGVYTIDYKGTIRYIAKYKSYYAIPFFKF